MSGTICTSNVTSGFIDLATYDEIEKYLYGGLKSCAYFVRETKKSTWFTQVPVCLQKCNGAVDFGKEASFTISRAGDYLLNTWLRVTLPSISVAFSSAVSVSCVAMWTPNLMHNLIREATVTANDLVVNRFDNYFLDFWAAFTVPKSKAAGYNFMIGNQTALTTPQVFIPQQSLNLPLPFFFSRDSGVSLPTAALPYNDLKINLCLAPMEDLVTVFEFDGAPGAATSQVLCKNLNNANCVIEVNGQTNSSARSLINSNLWANYAIVSNDERKRMGCGPRDVLIEQPYKFPAQDYIPDVVGGNVSYDLRFSHAVKALFFAVRNTTCKTLWSHYGTGPANVDYGSRAVPSDPLVGYSGQVPGEGFSYNNGRSQVLPPTLLKQCNRSYLYAVDHDPVAAASLLYENTARLANMGGLDYYGQVQPYYHGGAAPNAGNIWSPLSSVTKDSLSTGGASRVGLHMYSYSLDFLCLDPMGSTNYGKLTNVSLNLVFSDAAVASHNEGWYQPMARGNSTDGNNTIQTYQFVCSSVANNIVRYSGGALGFPVL
jgi:hypothetical protein